MNKLLLFLFAGFSFLANFVSANDTRSQDTQDLIPVNVQLKWKHQFQFAGYYAALKNGYYREAGLAVNLIEHSNGPSPIDKLNRGTVDFAIADAGAIIYRSNGVPLVALSAIFQHSPSILLTLSESNINQLLDLKSETIMMRRGYMNAELKSMLLKGGVSMDDLNLISSSTRLDALLNKRVTAINAYSTNEPFFVKQANLDYKIFYPRDYNVDLYGDILLTTENNIEQEPALVEAFLDATLRGWQYAVENPNETVELILSEFNSQNKTRANLMFEAQESIKLIQPNIVPIGYMDERRWRKITEVFEENGLISSKVNFDSFLYESDKRSLVSLFYERYKVYIFALVIAFLVLLVFLHIISLRLTIQRKTAELEEAKQRAEEDARTDPLTGLSNRRCFIERFSRDLSIALRQKFPISLISIDIDHFKSINDEYGHAVGDQVLRQVSKIFKENIRLGDIVARIGGEEFIILCLDSPRHEAKAFAERLRLQVEQSIFIVNTEAHRITCSFGVIEADTEQSEEQILRVADEALYKAKESGRNRVCCFED